jgi:hypothetical protein
MAWDRIFTVYYERRAEAEWVICGEYDPDVNENYLDRIPKSLRSNERAVANCTTDPRFSRVIYPAHSGRASW